MHLKFLGFWIAVLSQALCSYPLHSEAVKDREGAVRQDKAAMEKQDRWIYNDYQKGFQEARRTGKPLMVVLRCVPCLACAGIDSAVLLDNGELNSILSRFICVRVINANALDMKLFQTDFDLSFSTLFFNGDGTVYGRYGSWQHQKNSKDQTISGLKATMEAVLDVHRNYPKNRESLVGKQGRPTPFKTPVEMPELMNKYSLELNWNGKVVPSCVHCHQIGDATRLAYRSKNESIPETWIYPYPSPESIGLKMDSATAATVEQVIPNSAADLAGFKKSDRIEVIEGQNLVSPADLSYLLHGVGASGRLQSIVKRNGKRLNLELKLDTGWRRKSDISGRVGTWGMRGMATGGLLLKDMDDQERTQRGIDHSSLALKVVHVGEYGQHAAAKKAGVRKDDVIIRCDHISRRLSEGELIGHLLQKYSAGSKVDFTLQRGNESLSVQLPMQ